MELKIYNKLANITSTFGYKVFQTFAMILGLTVLPLLWKVDGVLSLGVRPLWQFTFLRSQFLALAAVLSIVAGVETIVWGLRRLYAFSHNGDTLLYKRGIACVMMGVTMIIVGGLSLVFPLLSTVAM